MEKFVENEIKALEICKNHPNVVKLHKVYRGQVYCLLLLLLDLLLLGGLLSNVRPNHLS